VLILRRVPRKGVRLPAALAATETTTALAIAHTAAGGERPSAGWLLVIVVTAYGAGLLVLRKRARMRVVLPAMVGLQVLMHAWLVALTEHAGHVHQPGALLGLSGPMLLAHVTAGVVAALAWALRRRAVDVLLTWDDLRDPAPHHATDAPGGQRRRSLAATFLAAAPTRGPPVVLVALG
jgi:hypothetical protein